MRFVGGDRWKRFSQVGWHGVLGAACAYTLHLCCTYFIIPDSVAVSELRKLPGNISRDAVPPTPSTIHHCRGVNEGQTGGGGNCGTPSTHCTVTDNHTLKQWFDGVQYGLLTIGREAKGSR